MSDLKDAVKSKLFGGKVRFRSEDQKSKEETMPPVPSDSDVQAEEEGQGISQ